MDLSAVIQFLTLVKCFLFIKINATQLILSHSKATAGNNFTLTCIVSSNGYIRFSKDDTTVCTITSTENDGSCVFNGDYDERFSYTCDPINRQYAVNIPGSVIDQLHQSKWNCEILWMGSLSQTKQLYVNVPVSMVTLLSTPYSNISLIVVENMPIQLECKTDPVRPAAVLQWYISGTNFTSLAIPQKDICYTDCNADKVVSSSILVYTGNRNDTGKNVYCAAINIDGYLAVNSSFKQIEIHYGPSQISLSTSKQYLSVLENGTIGPISCNAQCNPRCTHIWSGPAFISMANELRIISFDRTHTGIFTCTASNSVGRLQKNINILVQFPAVIKRLTISTENHSVSENTSLTISCIAKGEPIPKISWTFTDTFGNTMLLKINGIGYSEIVINRTNCKDTGTYSCTADNIIFPSSTKAIDLNVSCAPSQNATCSMNTSVEVQRNDLTSIYVCWISNPAPEVLWTLICDPNHTFSSSITQISTILYKNVRIKRFPDVTTVVYKVVARNRDGVSDPVYFEVIVKNASFSEWHELRNGANLLHIGISFFSGLATCAVISIIISRFYFYRRKPGRNKDYSEFQSKNEIEVQSYDILNQQQYGKKVDKSTNGDMMDHTYDECRIQEKEKGC